MATLDQAATTSGRLAREQLVRDNLADPTFSRVLQYALNPYKTYGIAKIPAYEFRWDGPEQCQQRLGQPAWLLLEALAAREITGNAARESLVDELSSLTRASAELLERIVKKDLACGITAETVNRVKVGTIPSFKVMLAHPFEEKRAKFPCWVEPKLDGYRVIALCEPDGVRFVSREGIEWTCFEHLKAAVEELAHAARSQVLPGECVAFDGEVMSGAFNETASALRSKSKGATDAVYHVFEVLPAVVFTNPAIKGHGVPYLNRRGVLERLFAERDPAGPIRLVPAVKVHDLEEVHARYELWRDLGYEGQIVKRTDAHYEKKRSHAFAKMKAEESVDVYVTGAYEGKDKYAGMLGGLIVDVEGVSVRVGGGFTDDQRVDLWHGYHEDLLFTECSDGPPPGWRPNTIGRLAEVFYHEKTPDGSLRHSRFKKFRDTVTGAKE